MLKSTSVLHCFCSVFSCNLCLCYKFHNLLFQIFKIKRKQDFQILQLFLCCERKWTITWPACSFLLYPLAGRLRVLQARLRTHLITISLITKRMKPLYSPSLSSTNLPMLVQLNIHILCLDRLVSEMFEKECGTNTSAIDKINNTSGVLPSLRDDASNHQKKWFCETSRLCESVLLIQFCPSVFPSVCASVKPFSQDWHSTFFWNLFHLKVRVP